MKNINGISIVIATKGRVKLLEDLLKSVLEARNNFEHNSEVILVDDSDSDDEKNISRLCEAYDARKITFGPSVAEKRNIGAKNAKYDIILFLDSDCIASENLLNEHYKLYDNEKIGGVAGLLEFVGPDTWFWEAVNKTPFVICFGFPKWMDTVPWTPTANCSMRKSVFEEIGGFDRTFPDKPGGEDVDLGLMMTKKGYIMKCSKDGIVYHSKKTWIPVKAMIKRLWHYGAANYYLADKHKDYVMNILPRKSTLFFVMLVITALTSIISKNILKLLVYPLWLILDICLMALMFNKFAPYKRTTFLKQCVVQLLIMDNELGYVFKCLKKGKLSYINKDVVYFDGQMDGILDNGAITTWSNAISSIIFFVAMFLI